MSVSLVQLPATLQTKLISSTDTNPIGRLEMIYTTGHTVLSGNSPSPATMLA